MVASASVARASSQGWFMEERIEATISAVDPGVSLCNITTRVQVDVCRDAVDLQLTLHSLHLGFDVVRTTGHKPNAVGVVSLWGYGRASSGRPGATASSGAVAGGEALASCWQGASCWTG